MSRRTHNVSLSLLCISFRTYYHKVYLCENSCVSLGSVFFKTYRYENKTVFMLLLFQPIYLRNVEVTYND